MVTQPGLGHTELGVQNAFLVYNTGGMDPGTQETFGCFPRCLGRELKWKQSSQNLQCCSAGLLDAEIDEIDIFIIKFQKLILSCIIQPKAKFSFLGYLCASKGCRA